MAVACQQVSVKWRAMKQLRWDLFPGPETRPPAWPGPRLAAAYV